MKFRGIFTWMGMSFTLYTDTTDRSRAFNNFLYQIAKKVDYSYHYIYCYFMSGKDNYLIEEIQNGAKDRSLEIH